MVGLQQGQPECDAPLRAGVLADGPSPPPLVIITLAGLAALASHLAQGAHVVIGVTGALAAAIGAGAVLGTRVGGRLPQHVFGRAFSIVVALVAVFLLVDTLAFYGPPGS